MEFDESVIHDILAKKKADLKWLISMIKSKEDATAALKADENKAKVEIALLEREIARYGQLGEKKEQEDGS